MLSESTCFEPHNFSTSTPKSSLTMEQARESSQDGYAEVHSTYYRSASTGPSSYQAMFGSRRGRSSGYGKYKYGYGGEASIVAVNVDQTFAQMPGILSSRSEEKEELGVLNNRFATYIDKVRRLESQNKTLQTKIFELESTKPSYNRSGDMYEDELARLRREIEALTHGKAEAEIQLHNCNQELRGLEKKILIEIEGRADADKTIKSLRKDIDNATLTRIDLERKIETLREELELTKATNNEDIKTLQSQVSFKQVEVFDSPQSAATDLTDSLRDIRIAYEKLSQNNKLDIESVYKTSIVDLQEQVKVANQNYNDAKGKLQDAQRQLQVITVEIEGLRTTNSSLEAQISELHDKCDRDGEEYQNMILKLEGEVQAARDKMTEHLADYNQLMNLKLSLDLEIATYRKLLEGEEGRISEAAASMEQSAYSTSIEKSVTNPGYNSIHSTSVSSTKSSTSTPLIIREKEVIRERRSSSSSSSSSSDSD